MDGGALISGIRKDHQNGLKHTGILSADDQTYTSKPAFLQLYKERIPAFTSLFHAFRGTEHLTVAILMSFKTVRTWVR